MEPGYRRSMPSSKPRVRRVPIAMPAMTSPSGAWFRNVHVSGFSALMLGIVVLFVVVLAPSLRTLIQQQEQIAQQEHLVAEQRADVATKQKDVARWNDPAYIEAQARDRLLYVYPGETSYLVTGTGSATASGSSSTPTTDSGAPVSTKLQTPKVDWVQAMLSSVLESGLTQQTREHLVAPKVSGTGATG